MLRVRPPARPPARPAAAARAPHPCAFLPPSPPPSPPSRNATQFGNLIALIGTGFLIGFLQQLKNMADEKRRIASAIYITALIGTLLAVFLIPNATAKFFAAILCIIVQFCALAWYTASYIPFAQSFITRVCSGCVKSGAAAATG